MGPKRHSSTSLSERCGGSAKNSSPCPACSTCATCRSWSARRVWHRARPTSTRCAARPFRRMYVGQTMVRGHGGGHDRHGLVHLARQHHGRLPAAALGLAGVRAHAVGCVPGSARINDARFTLGSRRTSSHKVRPRRSRPWGPWPPSPTHLRGYTFERQLDDRPRRVAIRDRSVSVRPTRRPALDCRVDDDGRATRQARGGAGERGDAGHGRDPVALDRRGGGHRPHGHVPRVRRTRRRRRKRDAGAGADVHDDRIRWASAMTTTPSTEHRA